jgi:hypothetical protein
MKNTLVSPAASVCRRRQHLAYIWAYIDNKSADVDTCPRGFNLAQRVWERTKRRYQ